MQSVAPCPKCGQSTPIGSYCANDGTHIVMAGPPSNNSSLSRQTLGKGVRVGEYILEDFLGKGGMGEVWSAQHPAIGKQVAVKVLSANALVNYEMLARFKREARAVNEIGHENLVDIFSFGELPDGRPYYLMELLRGESLAEYVKRKGPPTFSLIVEIFRQVCNALQAAHQTGVIHRDLKPDNIFLDKKKAPELSVKLLDFGIAKLTSNDEGGESLTRTGIPFGTPAYMSPEQCDGAKNLDHRADIYSLGIVLYELLTGRNPFREENESALELLMKHKKTEPAPPSKVAPQRGIPREVDALVLKALAKKPSDRFESAMALYEQLKKSLPKEGGTLPQTTDLSTAPTMASTGETAPVKASTTRLSRSKVIAFSFGAALALAIGAFLLLQKKTQPKPVAPPQSQSLPVKPKENHWRPRASPLPNATQLVLASSSKGELTAEKARDGKASTSWCEGAAGDGVGEWLAVRLSAPTSAEATLRVSAKASKDKEKANFPKVIRVELYAGEEKLGQQEISCSTTSCEAKLSTPGADALRLVIKQSNEESKSQNTCIAEVSVIEK